jgi:hypothetical protein
MTENQSHSSVWWAAYSTVNHDIHHLAKYTDRPSSYIKIYKGKFGKRKHEKIYAAGL